ncbi:Ubiquitin fusion degradation protein 1 [Wallemia ichthyophaga EXF-994]|uniref:Ubiquitin fusion degradation protein 1 n=1 Tax=Wallemia ichthyophaga (strain EXF-994 / CBS 113033) TaxID=1299270 RepID=R9AMI2_WALI9|nr:Ubiquitin fusion degradation protein 1 [Wallemia ichthyophaga EXF-994]EOR01291.1 Ubiquitin fusion degradation protein 1 [Wallemia ichthyophaga EXF-994]
MVSRVYSDSDDSVHSAEDLYNDDEFDDDDDPVPQPQPQSQPRSAFSRFNDVFGGFNELGGLGGFAGFGGHAFGRPPASAFTQHYKAFSVAMMGGNERPNLQYGGKIIMPPSALARLTDLEIESPWTFELSPARNPSKKTHAGVLEFIAEEGNVHLPAWMMKQLELDEGSPLKISGAALPKGKFTKLQAQTTDFLEISDHKTVLERALRNFSTLSKGDYIEILHNCITFELLVMEIDPESDSQSIFIIDTDLEVDFAPPKGYVEPAPKAREPQPTMASKMKIDTRAQEDSPLSSRPNSTAPEVFKGSGQTLGGRKTKGKGLAKPIEKVDDSSKISRTDKQRHVTADTLEDGQKVPAPLNLPFGKLFFGFEYVPIGGHKEDSKPPEPYGGGTGATLSGRSVDIPPVAPAPQPQHNDANKHDNESKEDNSDPWAKLGAGNSLSQRRDVIDIDSD